MIHKIALIHLMRYINISKFYGLMILFETLNSRSYEKKSPFHVCEISFMWLCSFFRSIAFQQMLVLSILLVLVAYQSSPHVMYMKNIKLTSSIRMFRNETEWMFTGIRDICMSLHQSITISSVSIWSKKSF